VKDAGALGWSDLAGGEAALIQRCIAGEESACAELVAGHERMVYTLALHLLGDRDEALDLAHAPVRLPAGVPEWLTPIVAIVAAQLFCLHLTRAKGFDTEAPRGLQKVTLTR